MLTIVSRGIDRRAFLPPPTRMSRIESLRLGPPTSAPGSLEPLVRASEPSTRTVFGLVEREAGAAERDLAGEVALLELGGDQEEDELSASQPIDGEDEPLDDAADVMRAADAGARARQAGEREAGGAGRGGSPCGRARRRRDGRARRAGGRRRSRSRSGRSGKSSSTDPPPRLRKLGPERYFLYSGGGSEGVTVWRVG